jgi:hypothetical protein
MPFLGKPHWRPWAISWHLVFGVVEVVVGHFLEETVGLTKRQAQFVLADLDFGAGHLLFHPSVTAGLWRHCAGLDFSQGTMLEDVEFGDNPVRQSRMAHNRPHIR